MKKITFTIFSSVFLLCIAPSFADVALTKDITSELPEIPVTEVLGYQKIKNVAQYKDANWDQVIGIARNISLRDAYEIADKNPAITYFFRTKGRQMVLETTSGEYRVFHHGDTVFFSGKPWWGSAPGLADGYVKQ